MNNKPDYLELLDKAINVLQKQRQEYILDNPYFERSSDELKLKKVKKLLFDLSTYERQT